VGERESKIGEKTHTHTHSLSLSLSHTHNTYIISGRERESACKRGRTRSGRKFGTLVAYTTAPIE
jgi:hypothetical protein